MNISIDDKNLVTIGKYTLNDDSEIFDDNEYRVRETKWEIESLKEQLRELRDSYFDICLEDLNFLNGIEDKFIFCSTSSNGMVIKSVDEEEFDMVCEAIIESIVDELECFMCFDCEEWFEEVDNKSRCKKCGERE